MTLKIQVLHTMAEAMRCTMPCSAPTPQSGARLVTTTVPYTAQWQSIHVSVCSFVETTLIPPPKCCACVLQKYESCAGVHAAWDGGYSISAGGWGMMLTHEEDLAYPDDCLSIQDGNDKSSFRYFQGCACIATGSREAHIID